MESRKMIENIDSLPDGYYLISRTSGMSGDACPCEGAYRVNRLHTSMSPRYITPDNVVTFYENPNSFWNTHGFNHRIVGGFYMRDVYWEAWAIAIPDLRAFLAEHGRCVISVEDGFLCLEIYDDYRE
jgi:hypothetical protein